VAFTKTSTPTALAGILITSSGLSAATNNNVTGNSSGSIYQIQVDNSANESQAVYLKIFDGATATPGTSIPNLTLQISGGKKMTFLMGDGHPYTSGVSLWCTTGAEVSATSNPSKSVSLNLLAS